MYWASRSHDPCGKQLIVADYWLCALNHRSLLHAECLCTRRILCTQYLKYLLEELLPKIGFHQVKFSLECRGKHPEDMNKFELMDLLHTALLLEKSVLGERLHRRIRQLELEVIKMTRKGRLTMAKTLRLEVRAAHTVCCMLARSCSVACFRVLSVATMTSIRCDCCRVHHCMQDTNCGGKATRNEHAGMCISSHLLLVHEYDVHATSMTLSTCPCRLSLCGGLSWR